MAVITAGAVGTAISVGSSLFGGNTDFAQLDRNNKRSALQRQGFTWRKTSGVPSGEEWNIDNYSTQALDNLARLYDRFGDIAVELHNNRKISSSRVAENYQTLQQLALAEQEKQRGGSGVSNMFSSGSGDRKLVNAGAGVLGAVAIAGGLFFIISRG